ncbi:GNAT family N-acetyltransferase [Anaerocolumna sp. MB42-C2]|uniref:GNAT family N-acetyltransferase n=1 Tax=Anaerocolumna sp. MB42-C2 TaxID=3070997 RepID=UPI0027E1EBC9|nr:GNAT family N-acetyltransferase [Anaerocolumna sp. MB42-C2]WMJ88841.1 GNAT family N-acetyltransferase [Anaerocolumna sp. MB42-C2]
MEYRKATLPDIDILTNMRVEMLCEERALSNSQRNLMKENTKQFLVDGMTNKSLISWIALNSQNIVSMGCINFFSFPPNDWCPNGKTAYIGNVYTLPDFRRKGIGSNIVSHLIEEAKQYQCQRILLNTTEMGRPLYEMHGFEDSSTAMAFYPFGIM